MSLQYAWVEMLIALGFSAESSILGSIQQEIRE
jgi:hypothetical protein